MKLYRYIEEREGLKHSKLIDEVFERASTFPMYYDVHKLEKNVYKWDDFITHKKNKIYRHDVVPSHVLNGLSKSALKNLLETVSYK